ncbi:MAG: hypothetical protein K6G65_08110 [Lachnospiraceae bacterium]|nr:hypothetical protein [Lachnospiraceae bacterium]
MSGLIIFIVLIILITKMSKKNGETSMPGPVAGNPPIRPEENNQRSSGMNGQKQTTGHDSSYKRTQDKSDGHGYEAGRREQKTQTSEYRRSDTRYHYAKNGDNGQIPGKNEQAVTCSYCGAINIIPIIRKGRYDCYFCREQLR